MKKNLSFIVVMLTFFTMGFVDLVGAASNHVQQDLSLTEAQTYFIPSLVFFWFLIFSLPTSALMNKIGRKNTVLVSLVVTLLSLALPIVGNSYYLMLAAFSLLGIGNAIMQTSLNPLVTNIIRGDKLASTLTFGQFVKAIASFMAPLIMTWGAVGAISIAGLEWRVIFVIYGMIGVIAATFLFLTHIDEAPAGKATGFIDSFGQDKMRQFACPCELNAFGIIDNEPNFIRRLGRNQSRDKGIETYGFPPPRPSTDQKVRQPSKFDNLTCPKFILSEDERERVVMCLPVQWRNLAGNQIHRQRRCYAISHL